jgi:predicted metal-dependent hydrolase
MIGSQAALPFDAPPGQDAETPWLVRRSARARRLALRVHLDGRVEVVVPRGVADPVVRGFMSRHVDWVKQKLAARPVPTMLEPFPPALIELPALGQSIRVHLSGGRGRPRPKLLAPGVLSLLGDWGGDAAGCRRVLLDWLIEHAHTRLESQLQALAEMNGFRFAALQLRRQRTRWGSCSARGVISLNVWAVLRYLMIHELAHTRHMNHSPAFWRTVEQCCADYRLLDRELSLGWRRVPRWVFR